MLSRARQIGTITLLATVGVGSVSLVVAMFASEEQIDRPKRSKSEPHPLPTQVTVDHAPTRQVTAIAALLPPLSPEAPQGLIPAEPDATGTAVAKLDHRQAKAILAGLDGLATEDKKTKPTSNPNGLVWPTVESRLTSHFGYRVSPITGAPRTLHRGVDVRARCGTPVVAAADGIITFADWTNASGNTVKMAHRQGMTTRYGHLSSLRIAAGDKVTAGTLIGFSGDTGAMSTGPHLHFEVWNGGAPRDPTGFRYRRLSSKSFGGRNEAAVCGSNTNPGTDAIMAAMSPAAAGNEIDPAEETVEDLYARLLRATSR